MKILETTAGNFNLSNALKIDVYKRIDKKSSIPQCWRCSIAIDQYVLTLAGFEVEQEAKMFVESVSANITAFLVGSHLLADLSEMCRIGMDDVLEKGEDDDTAGPE